MRSLILSTFMLLLTTLSIGQAFELCSDAEANVTNLVPAPSQATTINIDPAWTANADGYTSVNVGGPYTVGYFSFTVDAIGFYTINIEGGAVLPPTGDASISFSDNSIGSACPIDGTMDEIFSGMIPVMGAPATAGCFNFSPGTIYTMAIAFASGTEGEVIVTVVDNPGGGANDECSGALPMVTGANTGTNLCSDGLVWYSYTVVNGGSISLTSSMSATGTDISMPVITQVILDDCFSAPETVQGPTVWTFDCLAPGSIIYFEAGDDLDPIEQGNFDITIVDDPTGIANETCADVMATPTAAPTCETTILTIAGNNDTTIGACPDDFTGCTTHETESTVWFAFSTSADATLVDIEITAGIATEFALIDAAAGCPMMGSPATPLGGCQTGGQLLGQSITGGNTYYIAVSTAAFGTDGVFVLQVTPTIPPMNDVCTDAIDISSTAVAGVDGTTFCASPGMFDFCPVITEDHVVYYTYTVDASIATNRTVIITTSGSTATSGTAATSIGLGIFDDCFGAAPVMPSGAPLIPIANGSDPCDALAGTITYECVEPGTSFTIEVASSDLAEGDFNIMITEMATNTAMNDVCDIASNPDITSVTMGSNACADGEITFCGMNMTDDHQIWYTYTNTTGSNVDLGLTFTGTGSPTSATDLSMLVLVGDCNGTIFSGTTDMDYCSILDAGEQIISCIEDGETISILLGSEEDPSMMGPEGEFNISFTEVNNSPANDECTDAVDITPPNTCEWVAVSTLTPLLSAEFACPEDFAVFPAGCDFTTESTVWYSITVPNDGATYTLDIQNIANDAFLTVFEDNGGDCDSYGTPSINADCESGAGPHGVAYDNLTNGATYFIAVGDPTEASGFDFDIRLNMLPANDECADAVVLSSGAPTNGTTLCATQEIPAFNSTVCDDADEENTVWYEVTVNPGMRGFQLTITAGGASPIAGGANINAVVFESSAAGCVADGSTLVDEVCTMSGVTSDVFLCVGPGTYVIRVSTSDLNSGDFTIEFDEIALVQPNDNCDAPDMTLNPGLDCEWMTATATTIDACPEDAFLDPTNCGIDEFPVVWYSVTAPANADFLDLQINGAGVGTPFIAVYDEGPDCSMLSFVAGSSCYTGTFMDLVSGGNTLIPVTNGTTYLIAIGTNDLTGSTIDFGIKWITPPANDECLDAITLSAGSPSHDGTTACATQENPFFNADTCTDDDETNTVWYEYEVPPTDKGFNISITAAAVSGFSGNANIVVFDSAPGACDISGTSYVDDICTTSSVINEDFECVGPGTYVIRVSTSVLNEGGFTLEITPLATVQPNDFCDAPDQTAFSAGLECTWMDASAMTADACPEDAFLDPTNCGIDDFPVVWFEAVAPANAQFLDIRILNGGITPFIAVFDPGPDCSMLTQTAGSTCYTGAFDDLAGAGQAQIPVTAGTTYLFAVGTDAMAGGIINFGINWITPPANDDCAMAVGMTPSSPGAGPGEFTTGPIAGTTQCATQNPVLSGTNCDDDKTNTVWYSYTVEADVREITVDVTNYVNSNPTGAPTFNVSAFTDCASFTFVNQVDGTPADYCGGEGTDLITFSCLDEGDVIMIMVSSSVENEGTFDITLNTAMPNCTYTNDECAMASPLTGNPDPLVTDDPAGCVIVPGCNDLACTDLNFTACAGIDQLNTVFYTFTTDGNVDPVDGAFVNIEITNGEAGELDAPGAVLFQGGCGAALSVGACGAGAGGEYVSGPLGGPGLILPNTTYTIMIFNSDATQNGGTFDLCVTVSSGCVNDLCDNAFTLDPNVPVTNPASSENCTPDISISGCPATFDEATLWYQVTIPEGFNGFEVVLNNIPTSDGVNGEVSIAVGPLDNCAAVNAGDVIYSDCAGFTTDGGVHTVDCAVEFGTYYIQIGSEDDMDAGDFVITFNPILDPESMNDLCSMAFPLDIPETCVPFDFNGRLGQACPEVNPVGACAFDMNSAVWYRIMIPTGDPMVSDMDLELDGLGNPMLGVFEFDCAAVNDPSMGVISTPNLGDGTSAGCVQMNIAEGITVMPGLEYYILVSSSTNEQGTFTLTVRLNAPPENDDPCITGVNPPIDLTGGGSHAGTTCCARGANDLNPDGSRADLPNMECSAATEDAAVWYMYTPSEDDDGYNIILSGGDIEGPTSLEYYSGTPDAGCTGAVTLLGSSCNSNDADINVPNCFAPGEVLFVKVTSDDPDENCGTFMMRINPASCSIPTADECIDTANDTPIMPITNPAFTLDYVCVQGCLDLACPEVDNLGGCPAFVQSPTVWYQITADDLAAQMFTTVEANGNWDPVWSIYSGTSCDDLEIINTGGAPPCSDGDNTPDLHQVGVFDDIPDYWVAITADPASIPDGGIQDGTFEFCVATTITAIICLGEEIGDCDDPSLVMEIVDRQVQDQPLEGPFCQGEEVTINISFFYDATDSGADWLHGFVPTFGPGWDMTGFDFAANAPVGNGETAEWFEANSPNAPLIQEPNPILCTFINGNGDLTLCNQLCDPCTECTESGMQPGDPLPSGYFWISDGGTGCANDGSPGEHWGIGSTTAQIDWTFNLTVREFDSFDDCVANSDLSISFQTFSDGVAGCWEDPTGECILDRAMFSPDWMIECNAPPAVIGPDQELCFDGTTDILVQTEDGSTTQIQVDVIDNPNVSGENSYTFNNGTGTIEDNLMNLTGDVQVVVYQVFSVNPDLPCPGVINEIEVTIYPELQVDFPPVDVCEGDCVDITPTVIGGIGAPYTYNWSTGETGPVINVCPVVNTTYFVTVSDNLGCEGIGEVEVVVNPLVQPVLPVSFDVCKDNNFDPFNPDYVICADFDPNALGTPPYTFNWSADDNFGFIFETPFSIPPNCIAINELLSSEFGGANSDGTYIVTVEVTDAAGCMGSTDMIVNITGELIVDIQVPPIDCGDTDGTLIVTALDNAGNIVNDFRLFGGCDPANQDFIDDGFSNSGTVVFNIDLLEYTCYTVVAITASGCQASEFIEIPITMGNPIDIADVEVCEGDDATLTINNLNDYNMFVWTPDIGSSGSVTFTPDSTTTFTVEATDATGCTATELVTVTVNELPQVSISGTVTFCEGSSATVTASGGVSYEWTDGSMMETYTSSTNGEVTTVIITDANGCQNDSTITFTQEDIITIQLGNVDICDGMGDTVFVSQNFINVNWTDLSDNSVVSDTNFYVISGAGDFEVTAQDGPDGCDALGSFTVNDFATPMLNLPDTVGVCRMDSGIDSLCINFNSLTGGVAGSWSQIDPIPNFTFSDFSLDEVCFEGIQTGFYAFAYTTNSAQAPCINTVDTVLIEVRACPCPSPATEDIGPFCNNISTVNLQMAEITNDPGTWSVISGPVNQDLVDLIELPSTFNIAGILPGIYTLRFTLDNPGGGTCEEFSEIMIEIQAQDVIEANDEILCNIAGQSDPTSVDLFDLLPSVDAADGGSWDQIDGPMVTLTGSDASVVNSSDLVTFPQTLIFEYTSVAGVDDVCPPTVVQLSILVRDCNCPFVAVNPDTLCNDGALIVLDDLLENPDGLSGTWSSTNGTIVGTNQFDPNGLPSGLYGITFTLDTSPGQNCAIMYSNDILIRRQAVAIPTTAMAPCSVDTGNGPTTSNLYDWLESGYSSGSWTQTGGDAISFTDDGIDMAVVDFAGQDPNEEFMFTFTTSGAQEPCENITVDITITVIDCACPVITLDQPDPVCNDSGMIDLCALTGASGPGTFTVMSMGGTDFSDRIIDGCTFDATDLNAASYNLTFTLDEVVSGACTQSLTLVFDVSNFTSVTGNDEADVCSDPNGNGVLCINFTEQVSNAGAGTWVDVDGAGVAISTIPEQQNVCFDGVPNGTYRFDYVIDNDDPCDDFTHTFTVNVTDDCNCPPINLGTPVPICSTDGPVDLDQYADDNNSGTWSSTTLTVENGNSLVIDDAAAGIYTIFYTLDAPLPDCPPLDSIEIMVGEPANAGIANNTPELCEGDMMIINLDDLLDGEDTGGVWSSNSGGLSGNEFSTDGQLSGTYTFTYTISENDPCPEVSSDVMVIINPNPIADASDEKFLDCSNPDAILGGSGTSMGAEFSYSWTNLDTGLEISTDATFTVMVEGTYELVVTNNTTGCMDSDQVVVNQSDDLPTMDIEAQDISCNGQNDGILIISNQSGGDGNYSYSLNGAAPTDDVNSFTSLPAGDYTISIIDGEGCSQLFEFSIVEPDPVSVTIVADGLDNGIITGEPGDEFILSIDPVGDNIDSIVWSDFNDPSIIFCSGGLECSTINLTPSELTSSVYVEVFDANNCPAFDQVQLQLQQIVDVTFPNIISPNGDGINDIFYVNSDDVERVVDLKIFDRWGELVYVGSDLQPMLENNENGWDGTFKGEPVVSGVYVFIAEILFINGDSEKFEGDVTVIESD